LTNYRKRRIVTVKLGGSAMDDEKVIRQLAEDMHQLMSDNLAFVIVHGGGKAITREMDAAGVTPMKIAGLRITDDATMTVVETVMIRINKHVCDVLNSLGVLAESVIGADGLLLCEKAPPADASDDRIDLGRVGSVCEVNAEILMKIIAKNHVPVIAPFGKDASGTKLNVNADTAAGSIAGACSDEFILLTDVDGIYVGSHVDGEPMVELTLREIEELTQKGIIKDGMIPKTEACAHALKSGVELARIVNGLKDHPLLAIFSDNPVGTRIIK